MGVFLRVAQVSLFCVILDMLSDVTQSKASPKYEKCTFADTGRLNSTLDIPGPARKRLAVQKIPCENTTAFLEQIFIVPQYVLPYG